LVPPSYVIISALLTTAVDDNATFPLVLILHNPVGINVIDPPVNEIGLGAVIVEIVVVPDTNVIAAVGAIVEALAIVGAAEPDAVNPLITILPAMPTPPATVNAPVVVEVEVSVPSIAIEVPIIALRYDAIPPTTTKPPVIVLVDVNGPGDVIAAGVPRPTFNSDAIYE